MALKNWTKVPRRGRSLPSHAGAKVSWNVQDRGLQGALWGGAAPDTSLLAAALPAVVEGLQAAEAAAVAEATAAAAVDSPAVAELHLSVAMLCAGLLEHEGLFTCREP